MKVPTYQSESIPTARTSGVPSQLRISGSQLAAGARAQMSVAQGLGDVAQVAMGLYEKKRRDRELIEELQFKIDVDEKLQSLTTNALDTARSDQFLDAETEFANGVSDLIASSTRQITDPTRKQTFGLYVQSQALRFKPSVDEQILQTKYDIGTESFTKKLTLLQDSADVAPAALFPQAMDEIDQLYEAGVEFGLMTRQEALEHSVNTKRSSAVSWAGSQILRVADLETALAYTNDSSLYMPPQVNSVLTKEDRITIQQAFRKQASAVVSSRIVGAKGGSIAATKLERGQSTGVSQIDSIVGSLTLEERNDLIKSIRSGISNRLELEAKERSANEAVRNASKSQLTDNFNDALTLGDEDAMISAIDSMKQVDPLAARALDQRRLSRGDFPEATDQAALSMLRVKIQRGTATFDDIYRKDADGEVILDANGSPTYFMNAADFGTFAPQIKNLEAQELKDALIYARGYLELPEGVSQLADENAAFFKESRVFARVQSGLIQKMNEAKKRVVPFDAMSLVDDLLQKEVGEYEALEIRTVSRATKRVYDRLVSDGFIEKGTSYQDTLNKIRLYQNNLSSMPIEYRQRNRYQGLMAQFTKAVDLGLE